MKLTEEQFELIEAYLKDELSVTDRTSFEQDIAADAELLAEVYRQRDFRLGLRALGIQRALDQARERYKAPTATSEPITIVRPLSTWRYWVAAASVVVVLGIGYYAYQQSASRQADIAYAETSDTNDTLLKNFPSGTVSAKTRARFLDALSKYKAGKHEDVISQLKTLPADKKTVHYKNYLLGLSYLANKQPTTAIPLLSQARLSSTRQIRQKAEWFLALAYVKNDQKKRALPILKRISTDRAHPFQALAQRVLRKIS